MSYESHIFVLHARSIEHTGEESVIAEGVGEEGFTFLECVAPADAKFQVGDRVAVEDEDGRIDHVRSRLTIDELSAVAMQALQEAVTALVEHNEGRFVEVFNTAGPLSIRRHQLDLIPGVGEARRNRILDERDRQPFAGFEDLTDRVQGLSEPESLVAQRIVTELVDQDVQYRLFVKQS